jgi:hypothetical protein
MDVQAILDRFFVIKATKKYGQTAIGGFGQAKEFIALAWIGFRVRSLDAEVSGSGSSWPELDASSGHPDLQGTLVEVVMPADKHTTVMAAVSFIEKCTMPDVNFTVNDRPVRAVLKPGQYKRTLGEGTEQDYGTKVYVNKKLDLDEAIIRARGLYMFSESLPSDFKGTVVIELEPRTDRYPRPKDLFNATRTKLSYIGAGEQVSNFLQKARADVREALRAEQQLVRKEFSGTGQFRLDAYERAAALRDIMGPLPEREPGKDTGLMMDGERKEQVLKFIANLAEGIEEDTDGDESETIGLLSADNAAVMTDMAFKGESHVEAAVSQLVWKPDFILMNDDTMRKGFRIERRFKPETMSSQVLALARFWSEVVRFIFIAGGAYTKWGTGFVFSKEALGLWYTSEKTNKRYICLNPFDPNTGKLLSIRNEQHLSHIFEIAIHECAHHIDAYDYHSESWRDEFEKLLRMLLRFWPHVKRIAKNIKIRGTGAETRRTKKSAATIECEIDTVATGSVTHMVVRPKESEVLDQFFEYFVSEEGINLFVYDEMREKFVRENVGSGKVYDDLGPVAAVKRDWVMDSIKAAYSIDAPDRISPRKWFVEDAMPTEVWLRPDGFLQLRPADRRSVRYMMTDWNVPMSVTAPVLAQYDDINKLVNAVINMKLKPYMDDTYEYIFASLLNGEHVILPYDPYIYTEELRNYLDNLRAGVYGEYGGVPYPPMGDPVSPVNVNVLFGEVGVSAHLQVVHLDALKWYSWAYGMGNVNEITVRIAQGPSWEAFLKHVPKTPRQELESGYNVWDLELDRHVFELLLESKLSISRRPPIDPPVFTVQRP